MPPTKPLGSYNLELANAIREYHETLLTKGANRRRSHGNPDSAPITQSVLAACTDIDTGEFSRFLNGKRAIGQEPLFRLISMPWVSLEAAQRWMFLWMSNELDRYSIPEPDEEISYLKAMKSPSWNTNSNLDRLGDSLMKLADYTPTLGVIHQIDHARRRRREAIRDEAYRLPAQGPRIWKDDLNAPFTSKSMEKVIQSYKQKAPLTALSVKFAQDIANQEAEEHETELNGYLNEEVDDAKDPLNN